ncbi:MAG: bifunctional diguanylate cyclase/phosphodiesterase [Pseudomonadota bacterium]
MRQAAQSTPRTRTLPMFRSATVIDGLQSPWAIALVPTMCLAAYIGFGRVGLIIVAVVLPIVLLAARQIWTRRRAKLNSSDPVTGLGRRDSLIQRLDDARGNDADNRRNMACFALGFEEFETLSARYGDNATRNILVEAADRLRKATREWDAVVRLDGPRFCVGLTQLHRVDLEMAIEIASRFQNALSEPFQIDGLKVYPTCSVGICLPPVAPSLTAEGLISGAERALDEALAITGGAIRRYSQGMLKKDRDHGVLRAEALNALTDGRITPWFQPQVSTDTGLVTGLEVLARWDDPDRGLISPGDFLPVLETEGLLVRLGEVILNGALSALKACDEARLGVPSVGINVTEAELRDPTFSNRVRWELDRHEVDPARLTIEVLETVTSDGADDMVSRNLAALVRLGCKIDLDDFGTGNASLSSLRRFEVHRLKIDRSYISNVDSDPSQQAMVAAIVTMAEQLKLETLAEGVETVGEHAMVAQLGCLHVQGYVVARPMPFDALSSWIHEHRQQAGPVALPGFASHANEDKDRNTGDGKTA